MGSLRLLQNLSLVIDIRIDEGPKQAQAESRLRTEIRIKKQEQGLKDGQIVFAANSALLYQS